MPTTWDEEWFALDTAQMEFGKETLEWQRFERAKKLVAEGFEGNGFEALARAHEERTRGADHRRCGKCGGTGIRIDSKRTVLLCECQWRQ